MKKKEFVTPELDILYFETSSDILTLSNGSSDASGDNVNAGDWS